MRIAYTCQLISKFGGLERIIVDKANAMAARGHDVCLIVNNPPGESPCYDIDSRVRLFNISLPKPSGPIDTLLFKIRQNLRIYRTLRKFRPDIAVAVPTWLTLSIIFSPGRLVLESHTNRPIMFDKEHRSRYKQMKVGLAERRAAVVVTLTEEDAANWPRAKRRVIITNFSNVRTSGRNIDRNKAIAVGRLSKEKQFDLLLDAWALVLKTHPASILEIYGEGEERQQLEKQIERLGISGSVRLCGNTTDIARQYSTHGFLVMSSRREGFPLALIEAMQCGCPCVSVDCPCGPREIIIHGENGLLVPYRGLSRKQQTENIAESVCRMFSQPELVEELGRNALGSAGRFDKDSIIGRWEELFRTVTDKQ